MGRIIFLILVLAILIVGVAPATADTTHNPPHNPPCVGVPAPGHSPEWVGVPGATPPADFTCADGLTRGFLGTPDFILTGLAGQAYLDSQRGQVPVLLTSIMGAKGTTTKTTTLKTAAVWCLTPAELICGQKKVRSFISTWMATVRTLDNGETERVKTLDGGKTDRLAINVHSTDIQAALDAANGIRVVEGNGDETIGKDGKIKSGGSKKLFKLRNQRGLSPVRYRGIGGAFSLTTGSAALPPQVGYADLSAPTEPIISLATPLMWYEKGTAAGWTVWPLVGLAAGAGIGVGIVCGAGDCSSDDEVVPLNGQMIHQNEEHRDWIIGLVAGGGGGAVLGALGYLLYLRGLGDDPALPATQAGKVALTAQGVRVAF